MLKRISFILLLIALIVPSSIQAQDLHPFSKPDDTVSLSLSAEDWVTTKTARVVVMIEAAVSSSNAGSMRAEMMKSVNELAKADWRLTSFNRSLDQTGLERWSTSLEARLPESDLSSLNDNSKKLSKAGMQLSIGQIDFSPTLEETETTRAQLRTKIYKDINDTLSTLNTAFPGRNYRVGNIEFNTDNVIVPTPMIPGRSNMMKAVSMLASAPAVSSDAAMERSEKIVLTAQVTFAANPTGSDTKH